VEVITSPTKLNGFKKAISKIGVTGMTVSQVMGCGVQKGTPEYEDGIHDEIELLPKQMIMMVLEKDKLKKVLDIIKKELYTGHIGDGKIFVSNITDIIRVRTGEEGTDALH
jgi:nitrogen regulatory protein PII